MLKRAFASSGPILSIAIAELFKKWCNFSFLLLPVPVGISDKQPFSLCFLRFMHVFSASDEKMEVSVLSDNFSNFLTKLSKELRIISEFGVDSFLSFLTSLDCLNTTLKFFCISFQNSFFWKLFLLCFEQHEIYLVLHQRLQNVFEFYFSSDNSCQVLSISQHYLKKFQEI